MRVLANIISFLTVGLFSTQTWAINQIEKKVKHNNLSKDQISYTCDSLLKLEETNEISIEEHIIGKKLYEIINQIADHPLEYCEIMASKIIEHDPDNQSL